MHASGPVCMQVTGVGRTSSACSSVEAMESTQPSSVSMSLSHLTASGSELTASGIELNLIGALPTPPMRRLATSDVLRSTAAALPEDGRGAAAAPPAADSRRLPGLDLASAAAACSWNSAGAVRPWRCIHCENTCTASGVADTASSLIFRTAPASSLNCASNCGKCSALRECYGMSLISRS